MKKTLLMAGAAALVCAGCVNSPVNFAWRGVSESNRQTATLEGRISSRPNKGATQINAEKTTDLQADVAREKTTAEK